MASLLLLAAVVAGCDDPSASREQAGVLTARVVSPNGAEGAALVEVSGAIEELAADAGTTVSGAPAGGGITRVLVVRNAPGELSFRFRVPDVGRPPSARVVEVADGSDQPRADVSGYVVRY